MVTIVGKNENVPHYWNISQPYKYSCFPLSSPMLIEIPVEVMEIQQNLAKSTLVLCCKLFKWKTWVPDSVGEEVVVSVLQRHSCYTQHAQ